MTTTDTERTAFEALTSLGFTLETMTGPTGAVSHEGETPWPHIAYTVRLLFKGREVLTTQYSMGVGHAKVPKRWEDQPAGLTKDEICAFNTLRNNPHAQLKDKMLHASFAAKLAKAQKLTPQLADVMQSLMLDATAHDMTFEDWCGELGYDSDSRKAEAIFNACDKIARQLNRAVPADILNKARLATENL